MMETFSYGSLATPSLEEDADDGHLDGDLNTISFVI